VAVRILSASSPTPCFALNRSTFGWRVFPVGGNEEGAILSGIRTNRTKIVTLAIAGLTVGLTPAIASLRISLGQAAAGTGMELRAIAAVIPVRSP